MLLHEEYAARERQWLQTKGRQLAFGAHRGAAALRQRILTALPALAGDGVVAYVWKTDGSGIVGTVKDEIKVWRQFRRFNDRTTKSLLEEFFKRLNGIVADDALFDFYGSLYWVKKEDDYWCILAKRYPPAIRGPLIELQNAVADYEQLKSMRNPIYASYFLTFILVTILILFLSIWCAFYLARGITKPIQELLDATAQIRRGRWDVQLPCQASDDLRTLVEGFNEMMHTIQQAKVQLESRHHELFTILENIKAAVLVVNAYGRIVMCNAAARDMIARFMVIEKVSGKRINVLGSSITKQFFELLRELHKTGQPNISREIVLSLQGESRFFVTTVSFVKINNLPKSIERGGVDCS